MSNSTELFTISFMKNSLDDDYTFFSDGRVEHLWDNNNWSVNNTDTTHVSKLDAADREKLMDKCADEHKAHLQNLFDLFPL